MWLNWYFSDKNDLFYKVPKYVKYISQDIIYNSCVLRPQMNELPRFVVYTVVWFSSSNWGLYGILSVQ